MWIRNSIFAAAVLAIAAAIISRPREIPTAPAVELTTLQGEKLALGQLRGKVVLINFWATTCSVCIKEMPQMVQMTRRFSSRGFDALFIAMPYDRPDHVLEFARTRAPQLKIALDVQGEINRAFGGITLTPTTLIVDRSGRIIERIVGQPDFRKLDALIERLLAAG